MCIHEHISKANTNHADTKVMVTNPSVSTNSNSQADNQKCCKVPQITEKMTNTKSKSKREKNQKCCKVPYYSVTSSRTMLT